MSSFLTNLLDKRLLDNGFKASVPLQYKNLNEMSNVPEEILEILCNFMEIVHYCERVP